MHSAIVAKNGPPAGAMRAGVVLEAVKGLRRDLMDVDEAPWWTDEGRTASESGHVVVLGESGGPQPLERQAGGRAGLDWIG